jgi:hypothetical protein
MTKTIVYLIIGVSSVLPLHPSAAGPLTSAEVTKIINHVDVVDPRKGDHPAEVRDVIKDDLGLLTGAQSRSELLFQDNTLTRVGAETFFSFRTGTRDMTLERGSMLLQVPKGLGGAKIRTAAVTAAITGTTIMMEYVPKQYIKVLVLEGSLRLSRNRVFGDSLVLHPGKMVIMRPDAKKIPDPIDVDLQHVVQTSSLVNFPGSKPLPSMSLIQAAIQEQTKQFAKSNLVRTNLVMGHGTNVVVASANQLAQVLSAGGILGTAINAPVAGLKSAGLPLIAPAAVTTAVNNVLSLTTGTVSSLTTGLAAPASAILSVPVSTTTVDNLLASTTGTVISVANNLSAAASAVPSVSASTVGAISTNLSSGAVPTVSIPVSSSSQLISLVANAVPSASGTITIPPPSAAPASAAVAAASTAPAATASLPKASSVNPTVLSTVASVPITVATVPVTTQSVASTSASLKLGR